MKAKIKMEVLPFDDDGGTGNGSNIVYVPINTDWQWLWAISDHGIFNKKGKKIIKGLSDYNLTALQLWVRYNKSQQSDKSDYKTIPSDILKGSEDIKIEREYRLIEDIKPRLIPLIPGKLDLVKQWYENNYPPEVFIKMHVQALVAKLASGGPRFKMARMKVASGKDSSGVKALRLCRIGKHGPKDLFKLPQDYIYTVTGTLKNAEKCKLRLRPKEVPGPVCEVVDN